MRPDGPDIIIVEKAIVPRLATKDEAVPLDAEGVRRLDVTGEITEHEARIIGA
jgi:hypothetical protein